MENGAGSSCPLHDAVMDYSYFRRQDKAGCLATGEFENSGKSKSEVGCAFGKGGGTGPVEEGEGFP